MINDSFLFGRQYKFKFSLIWNNSFLFKFGWWRESVNRLENNVMNIYIYIYNINPWPVWHWDYVREWVLNVRWEALTNWGIPNQMVLEYKLLLWGKYAEAWTERGGTHNGFLIIGHIIPFKTQMAKWYKGNITHQTTCKHRVIQKLSWHEG